MAIFALALTLIAAYLTAVAGAHGYGSRKLWIGCIFIGLLAGFAGMMLSDALYGTGAQTGFIFAKGVSLWTLIIHVAFGFSFGSFLATLLYKKKPPVNQLGLR